MNHSTLTKLGNARRAGLLTTGVLAAAFGACASEPTPQLKDARNAYEQADNTQVEKQSPRDLERARIALDRAEAAHDENPGSEREMQLAKRAEYRAHVAMAHTDSDDAALRHRAERVDDQPRVVSERAAIREERAGGERVAVEPVRTAEPRSADVQRPATAPTKAEERKAAVALQNLGAVANVKEEPRGVVITLSGKLLFPNGKEQISPIAQKNLDQVAHALAQQPASTTFQVAGYTDNSGSDSQNKQLAKERAQVVADRLVQAGIDPARIRVVGYGETQPIADNDSAEGRASNRRVEIVAEPHQG